MNLKQFFFFAIFIFFYNIILSQNLVKAFEYIEIKEYDKAQKIFSKSINSGKDVVVAKYGAAVVYTRKDYHTPDYNRAYSFLETVKENFITYSSYSQQLYDEKYGISLKNIDSLMQWIVNQEYTVVKSNFTDENFRRFMNNFSDTKQADDLIYYRDSIYFESVKQDGSLYAFMKFVVDYPESKFKPSAIYKRDSIWKEMYNYTFRSLEIFSITSFEDKYPDCPFYNDSTNIYKELAKQAWALKLHFGYLESTNDYYGEFIKSAAPFEMAFQTLLVLIQPDIKNENRSNALDTIEKYKIYFGKFKKIDDLISILNRPKNIVEKKDVGNGVNTKGYEYMPVLTADNLTMYFCGEQRDDNIDEKGEDIFVSYFENGQWSSAKIVNQLSRHNSNEAPLSVSPDGNSLIVFNNGDVFISEKTKNGWSNLKPLTEINTPQYWEADAFITADGNAILFASDRYGNVGQYYPFSNYFHGDYVGNLDIYVVTKKGNGWSKPVNLGKSINTPYAERTPFLHPDMKTLYFSSDGHAGMGKIDVFKSTRLSDTSWTQWSEPVNLGIEINSPNKEYGYKISTDGTKAYFTHFLANHSDIYYVTLPEEDRPEQVTIITGKVTDNQNIPLEADIIWEDLATGKKIGNLKTDPNTGQYIITLPLGKNYGFYVSKQEYYPVSENIDLTDEKNSRNITKDFQMTKIEDIIQNNASIELNNVFFDFDKYELKKESYPELQRLADFLISQPDIKGEISGHTDNVGSKEYNKKLSHNRANAVASYLIELGCNKNQLVTVGYGDEKPIADNLTEEGRQQNRRVEFKVIQ